MKNKLILILAIIIIASVAVIFATKTKTKETGDSLSRILNKNTFIRGLDDSFPPMGYRNEDNEIVGFDIDVAKEVCNRLGVQLVINQFHGMQKSKSLIHTT